MDSKQIIHYAIQMEKLNTEQSFGNLKALLSDLDDACISVEQLQNTDIVNVLYKIMKTCADDSVKRSVKRLLSKWKKLYGRSDQTLRDTRAATCNKNDGELSGSAGVTDHSADTADDTVCTQVDVVHVSPTHSHTWDGGGGVCEKSKAETLSVNVERSSVTISGSGTPGTPNATGDFSALRSKCLHLLLGALLASAAAPDSTEPGEKVSALAGDIEQSIHRLHAANQPKYKACVRSKVANLKNPKSGHLGRGLLSGSLTPGAFARMSAEEMASEELQRLREEYTSRAVSERQLPRGVEGTPTQKIRCRRCDSLDSTVTQVPRGVLFLPAWAQRGGPDADAMTFVTCSGCGEQWYHSGWNCL